MHHDPGQVRVEYRPVRGKGGGAMIDPPLIILGIDPARRSGWAITRDYAYLQHGLATTATHRAYAIKTARELAAVYETPLIVIGERWQGGWAKGRGHARTISGVGAQWGRWQEALEAAGIPKRRILRVGQSTWRARVIGGRVARKTEEWDRVMVASAKALYPDLAFYWLKPDEAAALLICRWGTRAPEVQAVLPKKRAARRAG